MSTLLIISIILITLALVFYSMGIWAERISFYLKSWHVIMFWLGFAFDVSGTLSMHFFAEGPFDIREPHTLTGQIALWLMLIHAIWASWVVKKGSEKTRMNFHKYSLFVWLVWLIPYFSGVLLGMRQ